MSRLNRKNESQGIRVIEMPDTDREISRIVAREAIIAVARDIRDEKGLSDNEMSDLLSTSSEVFKER